MADLYRDFVFTRNTVQVTDTDTQIQVEDVSLFPSNETLKKGEFYLAFDSGLTYPHSFEIVRLLSVDVGTKTLTVARGQAGSVAVPHAIVTYIKGTLNADQVRQARAGFSGTSAPAPDANVFLPGDRFYHASEGRYYAFSGNAAYLRDTFTRAASTTTMGRTEVQTVTGEANGVLVPQVSQVVPYTAPWVPNAANIFGVNADGRGYLVSGVTDAAVVVNVGSTDFDISFDMFMSTTAGSDYGIFFRADTDQRHGYYLQFLGTTAALFRRTSGTFAAITGTSTTYGTGVTRTWRVLADGNRIRVFRDGTQVIDYTETSVGFLVGNVPYRPEAHVGIRFGNAAAVGDTAITWDNFSCTAPGNTGLNTPRPQGWAPATSQHTSQYLLKQLQRVQTDVSTLGTFGDDLLQATIGLEQSQGTQSGDIATIATAMDDLLEAYKNQTSYDYLGAMFAATATQVDEIGEILRQVVRAGDGPPRGIPADGDLYSDTASRRVYVGVNGAWQALTYSGPGVTPTTPTYVDGYTVGKSSGLTFTVPSTASAGDLCFVQVSTVNTGTIPTAPAGWTMIASGAFAPYNWHTYGFAYKTLTSTDVGATYTFGGTQTDYTQQVRVYRGSRYDPAYSKYVATTSGSGSQTVTGPTVTTPVANCLIVTWFALDIYNQDNFTLINPQSNALVTSDYQNHMSQGSQDEYLAVAGTTVARQFSYINAWSTSGYSAATFALLPVGEEVLSPGATVGQGLPSSSPARGSLYLDSNSNALYLFTGTTWVGVNRRVVRTQGDYTARGNDYILADTTASGRSSFAADPDVSTYKIDIADPATVSLTSTVEDTVYVGIRASWGTPGWTATLDGAAMTLGRRQQAGGFSISDLFVATTKVAAGAHNVAFAGITQHGIAWASVIALRGVTPTNVAHTGAAYTNNINLTLPAGGAGVIVLYSQVNGGTVPSMTGTGGLTWTDRGGQAHGSQNASRWWTATYTAAQAGTTISITTTPNDTNYGHIQAAMFPASGDPSAFDPSNYSVITLPANARGGQVVVQSNDEASNEIRIVPASGTINGANEDHLTARYQSMVYTSDGTNWFSATPKQGAVLRRSADYVARDRDVLLVDASAANRFVTLPLARQGRTVTVKKIDASANTVSVTGAGATPQTIDGGSSVTLTAQYETQTYVADGTSWWRTR